MGRVDARLTALEGKHAALVCRCDSRVRVVWPADNRGNARPDPGPETCPVCGGLRTTLRVVYTKAGGEWVA